MAQLNLSYPDPANALLAAERIKGARIQNQYAPETSQLYNARQRQQLKSGNAALNLEKLQTLGNLFRGINDQASYDRAIETYIRIYPDEIGDLKKVPRQYDPKFVDSMIQVTTQTAERVAGMNLAGREITAQGAMERAKLTGESRVKAADIAAKGRVKAAEISATARKKQTVNKLPADVKWATDIVKKYSPKAMDPILATIVETQSPGLVEKLQSQSGKVPEPVQPIYSRALEILRQWTGTKSYDVTATNPQTGERVGWDDELQKWVPIKQ